ncbi:16S rRNA (cytidine1402-2'-O)-methyltransferase [Neomicrococcus aestuarii]|uniref:Ribosomal RNA small subunit methyltransferase I n=1 Tax=Neomicrococcus aestuarii TaxID=556325 RepID=A0A7W8TRE5_9MICC|nr:16S rRNA (cytidine(1402)-2'-O)-methyltransferase [Neomicrococcus aestuarii]MBB5511409.1 16S rRNA (cytidine1402-2'-O)-methyltransferase [Neomicrococcus aestuarii]
MERSVSPLRPGEIVLAGTPIGNLGDTTPRLEHALRTADIVAAEDTRRLHHLVNALGITLSGSVVSYHEHNEAERAAELLAAASSGKTVVIVSDAGMPTVSDPGFRAVHAAMEAGVNVTAIPGPSAVLTALAVSGLPTDRFTFEGFIPRKAGDRAERLSELSTERRTMVFFEAPHRVEALLGAMIDAFGASRRVAVCRELTKLHEEIIRGPLEDVHAWAKDNEVRGEIVVVLEGAPAQEKAQATDLVGSVNELIESGLRLKEAVQAVAQRERVPQRDLYAAVVESRKK